MERREPMAERFTAAMSPWLARLARLVAAFCRWDLI
jgi:hypothetical protein